MRENIGATKPDASLEEIVHAATMAGADEFIKVLPQGYDTLLEEGGTNLSDGFWAGGFSIRTSASVSLSWRASALSSLTSSEVASRAASPASS
jgi:hypothetical protein